MGEPGFPQGFPHKVEFLFIFVSLSPLHNKTRIKITIKSRYKITIQQNGYPLSFRTNIEHLQGFSSQSSKDVFYYGFLQREIHTR